MVWSANFINKHKLPHTMKFIIFDIGNVIVNADHNITYKRLQEYGIPSDSSRKFFDNDEYKEFSRGNINGRSFYEALIRYFGTSLTYNQIVKAHNEHLFGIDDNVVSILSRLPKESVVFLTDTNEWQTQRERELIDLTSYSDRIFRSHKIHMLKTDSNCFPHIIKRLGINPEKILLIDDSVEKVLMAQKYGLQTHQFTDSVQLTDYLTSKGIL